MAKHNTDLDKVGKQYLPEGFNLAVDRSRTARTVTKDVGRWRDKTNRMDLKGFDTRSARETPVSTIVKKIRGIRGRTSSGEDALFEEPLRFVRRGQRTRELLEDVKDEIYDFESFKVAVKKSWSTDGSLRELVNDITRDDAWQLLYNTPLIQSWVKGNTDDLGIDLIMHKYNIERNRARNVFQKLDAKSRARLFKDTKVGVRVKPTVVKVAVKPKIPMLRQKSKGGKFYQRTKPQRWTKLEERLLKNNKGKSTAKIFDIYRRVFSDKGRTDSSIRNKIYRLK